MSSDWLVDSITEIVHELNDQIYCKGYILDIQDNGEIINNTDNKLLDKFIGFFKSKGCEIKEDNINSLNEYLYEYFESDNIDGNEMDIDSLWYINVKDCKVYIFSLQGFSGDFIDTYKKMKSESFLRYVFNNYFKLDKKIKNIKDYISSELRDYINFCADKTGSENNIYDYINHISTLSYEGSTVSAKIALLNEELFSECINFHIKLEKPIKFEEYRKIRKLLETSDKTTYLIGDNKNIYGLGCFKNINELREDKNIFVIDFTDKFEYKFNRVSFVCNKMEYDSDSNIEIKQFAVKEYTMVNVKYGRADLREFRYSESILENALIGVFSLKEEVELLKKIISYAKDQKHGTTVVITTPECAESESKKLEKQSIKIEKMQFKDDNNLSSIINKITSIDGAIYLDTTGTCYAIGVILDGEADRDHGDSSRGARFNSAIKYSLKDSIKDKCIIIVISEDGMVDIIYNGGDYSKGSIKINELLDQVEKYYNNNDYDMVIEKCNEIISADPNNEKANLRLGIAYRRKGEYQKALEYYDSFLKRNPNSYKILNGKGVLLKKLDQSDESLECYNKAIAINPKYERAYYNKGNLLYKLNRNEEALECYDKAIEINPKYERAYNNKSIVLSEMGRKKEAEECKQIYYKLIK